MAEAQPTTVMISHNMCDQKFVEYLAENLSQAGLSVWYVTPTMSPSRVASMKGEAIVNCKIFIYVLSPESAKCTDCKDQLALAYISNRSIFPVGLQSFRKLSPHVDSGMKLMLAKINWTFFHKEDIYESSMKNLISSIETELRHMSRDECPTDAPPEDTGRDAFTINCHTNFNPDAAGEDSDEEEPSETLDTPRNNTRSGEVLSYEFWDRHFNGQEDVLWTEFRDKFVEDYEQRIVRSFGDDKVRWFTHLIYRDILDLEKRISRQVYREFTGKNVNADPDHFYHRLKKYAIGTLALREVFNIDSTVRLTAIQHLGSYQTPSVVNALFDLVEDPDPNIRAVAALALAKTGKKNVKIINKLIKMLNDEDRLVRESCCLSLAHMRATLATTNIIDVWRNDPISTVREAAQIAISRMGGKEAAEAMKLTQVLLGEIKALKTGTVSN